MGASPKGGEHFLARGEGGYRPGMLNPAERRPALAQRANIKNNFDKEDGVAPHNRETLRTIREERKRRKTFHIDEANQY